MPAATCPTATPWPRWAAPSSRSAGRGWRRRGPSARWPARGRRGALGGGAALALGTAAWYLLTVAAGGRAAVAYAVPVAAAWAAVALGRGRALRPGRRQLARRRRRACAPRPIAALAGALAGEALLLAGEWAGRAAAVVLAVELAVGPRAPGRRPPPGAARAHAAVFAVAAVAFAGIEDGVRDTLRLAGWAGP